MWFPYAIVMVCYQDRPFASALKVQQVLATFYGFHGTGAGWKARPRNLNWVAVKELNLSYYIGETILVTIYTYIYMVPPPLTQVFFNNLCSGTPPLDASWVRVMSWLGSANCF